MSHQTSVKTCKIYNTKNVSYALWVTKTCQQRFISYEKFTIPMGDAVGIVTHVRGQGEYEKSLYYLLSITVNLKIKS
jgi:hypothetical protein